MKSKGINPLERHAEKIFFALALAAFLGVLAAQFLTGPTRVQVGEKGGVPVDRAYKEVVTMAQSRLQRLRSEDVASEVPPSVGDIALEFQRRLEEAPIAVAELPTPLSRPTPIPGLDDRSPVTVRGSGPARFARPSVPTAENLVAWSFGGALDPAVVASLDGLAPFVPQEQPHDKFAVSLAARFEAAAMREALSADPDGEGPVSPVPARWWRRRMEVLDVEVWRRQVFEDGGGVSEPELLAPLPGRYSLRERLNEEGLAPSDLGMLIEQARSRSRAIRQPEYYHMIAGPRWRPPEEAEGSRMREARDLLAQLETLREERSELRERLERMQEQASLPGAGPRPAVAAAYQVGGGGGRGGREGGGRDPDAAARERRQRAAEELVAQIERVEDQLNDVQSRLKDLGADPEAPDPLAPLLEARPPVLPLSDVEEAIIWAHDVTAEPGATYQYRLRLRLPNPLYGRGSQVAEELRDLASRPTIYSAEMAWSEPVSVDEPQALFVVNARPAQSGAIGAQTPVATAEIYRFYYGHWRMERASLAPGDAAMALLDVSKYEAPIFELTQRSDGGYVAAGFEPASEPVRADTGWYLLDVVPAVSVDGRTAGGDRRWLAVMATPDEAIRTLDPDEEAGAPRRSALREAVKAGEVSEVRSPRGLDPRLLDGQEERERPERGPGVGGPGRGIGG